MRLINKKGSAHFEMIISFLFFTGFVFFLFLVLQPEDNKVLPSFAIDGLYNSFKENVSTNLSIAFLRVNYDGLDACFRVNVSKDKSIFSYPFKTGAARVFGLNDNEIASHFDGSNLHIMKDSTFLKVMFSPELNTTPYINCPSFLNDYEFGSIVERQVFSNNALVEMGSRYISDYNNLKRDLRVSDSLDFAVISESSSFDMRPSGGIPASTNVVTKDVVVEVIYEDGTLVNDRFSFRVW